MYMYIVENAGVLTGPVELPVTPGIGIQMPSNAIQLAEPLAEPARNHVWALLGEQPEQLPDYRGTVYDTASGAEQHYNELGDLPEGLTREPRPSADHAWAGEQWAIDPVLQAANAAKARKLLQADIDAERDRRIDAGVEFAGVTFQSRATDRENIAGAAQLGFMAMVAGAQPGDLRWSNPDQDFAWIATDNSLVPMDAQTVVAFGKAAAERKQTLIFAARQIKDMQSIPADFTDDKWWP
ncbi:MAG: DUF4376 domain-containing protein [Gammaproteobacteria bacterium]|nr:DUF4376 domain-containing protein [Gammaproteobacteria bacterium]MBU1859337.1 DUF4376 domain-containing protein [Gammaproteobacteria bacterium]